MRAQSIRPPRQPIRDRFLKERLTLEAMRRGEPLIYSGRIAAAGLVTLLGLSAVIPGGKRPF
jgi:hypothetical protein